MKEVSGEKFGFLIAYVLPGFVSLWGVSHFAPTVGGLCRLLARHTPALRPMSACRSQPQREISEGNAAARRIAEKCRYQLEGTFKNHGSLRGRYVHVERLALPRGECPPLSEVLPG